MVTGACFVEREPPSSAASIAACDSTCACLDPCLGRGLSWTAGAEVLQTSACPVDGHLGVSARPGGDRDNHHGARRSHFTVGHRLHVCGRRRPWLVPHAWHTRGLDPVPFAEHPEQSGRGPGVSARPNDVDGHFNPRDRRNLCVLQAATTPLAVGLTFLPKPRPLAASLLPQASQRANADVANRACRARSRASFARLGDDSATGLGEGFQLPVVTPYGARSAPAPHAHPVDVRRRTSFEVFCRASLTATPR